MDVRNCRGCGRLFNYLQGPHLCPACMQKLEEKFSQVKDYLEDNPHATIPEIAKTMKCQQDRLNSGSVRNVFTFPMIHHMGSAVNDVVR